MLSCRELLLLSSKIDWARSVTDGAPDLYCSVVGLVVSTCAKSFSDRFFLESVFIGLVFIFSVVGTFEGVCMLKSPSYDSVIDPVSPVIGTCTMDVRGFHCNEFLFDIRNRGFCIHGWRHP